MMNGPWKVGELAKKSGVSVRALHHYDALGLLSPSHRTAAGHRLYGEDDVIRLAQIKSLQQLGFSLEETGRLLGRNELSPQQIIEMHLDRVRRDIAHGQRLAARLEKLAASFRSADPVPVGEFFQAIEEMTMFEKYYTPEQMQQLKARADALGPEGMQAAQEEWPRLMADVRAEMEKGTDPSDPRVQALAKRWRELIEAFTGGDPAIEQSLRNLYAGEPVVHGWEHRRDRDLMEYVGKALSPRP